MLIYNDTFKEHLEYLIKVFAKFKKLYVVLSLIKSFLGYLLVNLLGFKVNSIGLLTIEERVDVL